MNIDIVNFEVCKEHYLMTKMVKKTQKNKIEYSPVYYYKKSNADCFILISKHLEEEITQWCIHNEVPLDKVIVLSNQEMKHLNAWVVLELIDKEIDFENICRLLMVIIENTTKIKLLENKIFKGGNIKKDRDLSNCLKSIINQNNKIDKDSKIVLFVKEKNKIELTSEEQLKHTVHQFYLKGVSEYYQYLIIKKGMSF